MDLPVWFSILYEIIDQDYRDEQHNDLEYVEGKIHVGVVSSDDPAKDNEKRNDQ